MTDVLGRDGRGSDDGAAPMDVARVTSSDVAPNVPPDVVDHNHIFVTEPVPPVVRSAYLAQVGRIAPQELCDRAIELADLTAFCTRPDGPSYRWYREVAWAGKTALASWFVLHAPAGARVVAFFISARFAAQNDRTAFVDAMVEQLADVLGQPVPAAVPEAMRDAHLARLFADAARACERQGERLVLVVDGLDEDRGMTVGPGSHSIASLLPAAPVAGMRVVVTSRPNPPLPADLPPHHPLRDPAIMKNLSLSPHAETMKIDAHRELRRLLRGTAVQVDILGLITASGGGLSRDDLAALTGRPGPEIAEQLSSEFGRAFGRRKKVWSRDCDVHVFGHEDLHESAIILLGRDRLAYYRERLHAWAAHWQQLGWPPDTPEYLLRGYFRLLQETDDAPRLVALAGTAARRARLLAVTGGDADVLTELDAAQAALLTQDDVDLTTVARLSVHRGRMRDSGARWPERLAVVWGALGQLARASALVDSLPDPGARVRVLSEWAWTVAALGRVEEAKEIADRAASTLHRSGDGEWRGRAVIDVARAMVACGEADVAETLVRGVHHAAHQDSALADLVAAVATSDLDAAVTLADRITDESRRGDALTAVVRAAIAGGEVARAETVARTTIGVAGRGPALILVVRALLAAGELSRAESTACDIVGPLDRAAALSAVVVALAARGEVDRAESVLTSLDPRYRDGSAAAALAGAFAARGEHRRAEQLVWSIRDPQALVDAVGAIRRVLLAAGAADWLRELAEHAETLADETDEPYERIAMLGAAVAASVDAGRIGVLSERASAEQSALTYSLQREYAVTTIVRAVTIAGDTDRAIALARSVAAVDVRWHALTAVADALITAGVAELPAPLTQGGGPDVLLRSRIRALAEAGGFERADSLARSIVDPESRARVRGDVAIALARAGAINHAAVVAGRIDSPFRTWPTMRAIVGAAIDRGAQSLVTAPLPPDLRATIAAELALAAVRDGETETAPRLADRAGTLARTSGPSAAWAGALAKLVRATVDAGDLGTARELAEHVCAGVEALTEPESHVSALGAAVSASVAVGDTDRANVLARRLIRLVNDGAAADRCLAGAIDALLDVDAFDQAELAARRITRTADRAVALIAIARAATATGRVTLAGRLVAEVGAPVGYRGNEEAWLPDLTTIVATLDGPDHAQHTARRTNDPRHALLAMMALARWLAETGDAGRARLIVEWVLSETIELKTTRAATDQRVAMTRALTALATALTAVGPASSVRQWIAAAERVARSIDDPDGRARSLVAVAEADPERARFLLAQAIHAADDWTIPLTALSRIDPAVVAEIAAEALRCG